MNCSLQSILGAREERWNFRLGLIKKHHRPVLSLSMVIPGPDKNLPGVLAGFSALTSRVDGVLMGRIVESHRMSGADGPSMHWVVDMVPEDLKALALEVEGNHPLGRIADLDVLGDNGEPLGRLDMGFPPRTCLLCDKPAKECGAARSHGLEDLVTEVRSILRGLNDA